MAINQTQVKNNVYKAIEVIAEKRIDSLKLDKTIIGTVDAKIFNTNNQYRIIYNGGSLYAYAQDDTTYLPNMTVYILVPESDFSNKKWIIGRVSNTQIDQNIDTVASALNNYSIIGNNTVFVKNENLKDALKLRSYSKKEENETFQDANFLYEASQPEISYLDINTVDLLTYVKKAKALSFAADFRTSLSREQQRTVSGDYGLIFNLKFKNPNTVYNTIQDKWNALEPNTKKEIVSNVSQQSSGTITTGTVTEIKRLNDYEKNIRTTINNDVNNNSKTVQDLQSDLQLRYEEMISFTSQIMTKLDKETLSLIEQYNQLITDLMKLTIDEQGNLITKQNIEQLYLDWFNESTSTYMETVESYYLSTDNMVGNPYSFSSYSHQYITIPIDAENFVGIDSIIFYCDGFIQDQEKEAQWLDDIFVKNIEINCLEELDDVNNDYRLILEFPQGAIFRTNDAIDYREVFAKLKYQNKEDLTSISSFSWFIKDSSVTVNDSNYNAYAGVGWRKISYDSVTSEKKFYADKNKSYENYYKVIATYNLESILVKEFILYNEANHHDISIISDSGLTFELSDTSKKLTCLVDNENITTNYTFYWYLNNIILDKDAEWYKEQIEILSSYGTITSDILRQISLYKSQLQQIDGITWNQNILIFPSSKIPSNGQVEIKCIVRQDNYDIGIAQVNLSQGDVITLKGYYIDIENGGQVFQYNEAGVSPASERYNEPIQIAPLQCKFYSPNGGEINKVNYTVKWKVPTEKTLLVIDKDKLVDDNIYPYAACVFSISEDYSYSAINNQITCVVEFNGDVYQETTDFYFGKVGDNGTNGTDVVAKIIPIEEKTNSLLNTEWLALNIQPINDSDYNIYWNTGAANNTPVLKLELYRRNILIDPSTYTRVNWSTTGSTKARNFKAFVSSSATANEIIGGVSYTPKNWDANNKEYANQIIIGQAALDLGDGKYQQYNYCYPIPTIIWEKEITQYHIGIDRQLTLREVLYNADGRNPLYNKNQGVKLNFDESRRIVWSTIGGIDENAATSCLEIKPSYQQISPSSEDNPQQKGWYVTNGNNQYVLTTDTSIISGKAYYELEKNFVYVNPTDVYSGEYTNNCVVAKIYTGIEENSLEATVIVPIHMSLNTYGLASLNAWDGNSIEINDEGGYVLAPQIGAGKKENDNSFTGVVMGVEHTDTEKIGLLGYSYGRQSIFLDAETGNATFGLPETRSSNNNSNEGQIQLVPGGQSHIGSWVFSNNFLYNVKDKNNNDKTIGSPYTGKYSSGHIVDINPRHKGMLISALPSYISIKGKELTVAPHPNNLIGTGDSLEVQIDPNQDSIFTIFRHYKEDASNDNSWIRDAIVGIDEHGRFYTNAVKAQSTTLGIGPIGAFGVEARYKPYIGTQVDMGGINIFKIFTNYDSTHNTISATSTLYFSGSSDIRDEYQRPLWFCGNTIDLKTSSKDNDGRLKLTTGETFLGVSTAKLELNSTASLITTGGLTTKSTTRNITATGTNTETLKDSNVTINGKLTETISGDLSQSIGGNSSIKLGGGRTSITEDNSLFQIKRENYYDFDLKTSGISCIDFKNSRFKIMTSGDFGDLTSEGGSIHIGANNTNRGLTLRTTPIEAGVQTAYNAGLILRPSRGGESHFNLYAEGQGQIFTDKTTINDYTHSSVYIRDFVNTYGLLIDKNENNQGLVWGRDGDNLKYCSIFAKGDIVGDSNIIVTSNLDVNNVRLRGMGESRQDLNNTLQTIINKLNELIDHYNAHTHYINRTESGQISVQIDEFGDAESNVLASTKVYTIGATAIAGNATPVIESENTLSGYPPSTVNGAISVDGFRLSGDWGISWRKGDSSISRDWSATLDGDTSATDSTVEQM